MEKVSIESGVEERRSDDSEGSGGDDDDDELVRVRWDDNDRESSSTVQRCK